MLSIKIFLWKTKSASSVACLWKKKRINAPVTKLSVTTVVLAVRNAFVDANRKTSFLVKIFYKLARNDSLCF